MACGSEVPIEEKEEKIDDFVALSFKSQLVFMMRARAEASLVACTSPSHRALKMYGSTETGASVS